MDARVSQANRFLSTSANLDRALQTITYTLHLLHAILGRLLTVRLSDAALFVASSILSNSRAVSLFSSRISSSGFATLTSFTTSTAALATLIDDVRIFLRLGSILSIYTWGASVYHFPPKDRILQSIAWSQVCACALFQYLENGAYLGSKGVLGFGPRKVSNWYIWSSRFWMAHVLLEFGRLGREWALRRENNRPALETSDKDDNGVEAKRGEIGKLEEKDGWWRQIYINAAWLPITVHYGTESGLTGEAPIAILGLIAGLPGLRDAWRDTS
ncbi:hypothetical protein MMC13_003554 [Lambiella insularis]|nr:hypothetical protein [Lambiella insularis]